MGRVGHGLARAAVVAAAIFDVPTFDLPILARHSRSSRPSTPTVLQTSGQALFAGRGLRGNRFRERVADRALRHPAARRGRLRLDVRPGVSMRPRRIRRVDHVREPRRISLNRLRNFTCAEPFGARWYASLIAFYSLGGAVPAGRGLLVLAEVVDIASERAESLDPHRRAVRELGDESKPAAYRLDIT